MTNLANLLERAEFVLEDERSEESDDLAERAASTLDYNVLKQSARATSETRRLRLALVKLGLLPYSHESVLKYKAKAAADVTTPWWVRTGLPALTVISGTAAALVGYADTKLPTLPDLSLIVGGAVLALAGAVLRTMVVDKRGVWRRERLAGYRGFVPTHVLEHAISIRNAFLNAQFYVEELVVEQRRIDPFLVCSYEYEDYYLDVWDEPGFGG